MTEIDVSSYKKPEPPNILDQMSKWQGLARNNVALESEKLGLLNTRYNYMIKALSALPDNATRDDFIKTGQSFVKLGFIPPEMQAMFIKNMPTDDSKLPEYKNYITRILLDNQQLYNVQRPTPQLINRGPDLLPATVSPETGVRQAGAPIQVGLSPGQAESPVTVRDATGRETTMPQQGFSQATGGGQPLPGIAAPPDNRLMGGGSLPATPPMPPSRPQSAPENNVWGPSPQQQAPQVQTQVPTQQRTGIEGPPALFEEGKKLYTQAQQEANVKLNSIKPVADVLHLIPKLTTGPGTDKLNILQSIASNLGFGFKDEASAYQEVNKALMRYIRDGGGQSDLDRANISESSPNITKQIEPALYKIAIKNMGYDLAKAVAPTVFKDMFKGQTPDLSKFGEFMATYPSKIDPRAFTFGYLSNDEKKALVEEMRKKSGGNKYQQEEYKKFETSINIARQFGLIP